MADFQYLAPDVPDFLSEITGLELLNSSTSLHLPPASFTRLDRPTNYNYKPEPQTKRGSMAQKGDDLDQERYADWSLYFDDFYFILHNLNSQLLSVNCNSSKIMNLKVKRRS